MYIKNCRYNFAINHQIANNYIRRSFLSISISEFSFLEIKDKCLELRKKINKIKLKDKNQLIIIFYINTEFIISINKTNGRDRIQF